MHIVHLTDKNIRWIASIALAVLLSTGYSFTANLHTHTMPDGRIVVHSHPYEKDETKTNGEDQHTHLYWDMLYLSQVNKILHHLLAPSLTLLDITIQPSDFRICEKTSSIDTCFFPHSLARSPPFSTLFPSA